MTFGRMMFKATTPVAVIPFWMQTLFCVLAMLSLLGPLMYYLLTHPFGVVDNGEFIGLFSGSLVCITLMVVGCPRADRYDGFSLKVPVYSFVAEAKTGHRVAGNIRALDVNHARRRLERAELKVKILLQQAP